MKQAGLFLAALLCIVGLAIAADQTRTLGLRYGGNEDMNRNLDKIDEAFRARPTTTSTSTTTTSSSTSTSTSTSTSSTTL